jgi:hypothetical protein
VIGEELRDGRRSCEENDAQYFWSAVRAEGATGSLKGARGTTSAAIVARNCTVLPCCCTRCRCSNRFFLSMRVDPEFGAPQCRYSTNADAPKSTSPPLHLALHNDPSSLGLCGRSDRAYALRSPEDRVLFQLAAASRSRCNPETVKMRISYSDLLYL